MVYVFYIVLQPQSPCSCATEIFHFWLICIHSNARNAIFQNCLVEISPTTSKGYQACYLLIKYTE